MGVRIGRQFRVQRARPHRTLAFCMLASAFVLTPIADAQTPSGGRLSVAVGLTSGNYHSEQGLFVEGVYRVVQMGPVTWGLSAARGQPFRWHHAVELVTPACLGCPFDAGKISLTWRSGIVLRLEKMPHVLSRVSPFIGTGVYHATWRDLPGWDAARPPVTTGYGVVGTGVRLSSRPSVSFELGLLQLRNVRYRDHHTEARLAVRWDVP